MFWTVVNFVILVAAIVYFARKPAAQSFSDKHHTIKTAIEEAEELRKSVEVMVHEYQAKISNLDREISEILKEAKNQGEKEKAEILKRAEKMAEKILEDAKLQALKEKDKIELALKNETLKTAAEKALSLLQSKISEKEHKAFVSELIKGAERFHG